MLPEIEIPVSHAKGDNNAYLDARAYISYMFGDWNATTVQDDAFIDAPDSNIYVLGDYYEANWQFDPHVAEIWSANNVAGALWKPKSGELPKSVLNYIMKHGDLKDFHYAMVYDGWLDDDTANAPIKPEGATRYGEILGYDIYAPNGETFVKSEGMWQTDVSSYLKATDSISSEWAIINAYRAVGVEIISVVYQVYDSLAPKSYSWLTGGRAFDINASPLVFELSGNIDPEATGMSKGIIGVGATRTDPSRYLQRYGEDSINTNLTAGSMTYIDFIQLVAELMHKYGEPVITEMEEYMLLEAYGRDLPYDLYEIQQDAVKYMLVRGIMDSPTEFQTDKAVYEINWHDPIPFDVAATILMRVKDKESRLTFKEFQLTTDLELLNKGYYPTNVSVVQDDLYFRFTEQENTAASATYYDFLVKRADSRALFLAADDSVLGVKTEVQPFISGEVDAWNEKLKDTTYLGRTSEGYYHFRVSVGQMKKLDGSPRQYLYINSMNSESDNPSQYRIDLNTGHGGVYIINGEGANSTVKRAKFDDANMSIQYIDQERRNEALQVTISPMAPNDAKPISAYTLEVSQKLATYLCKPGETAADDANNLWAYVSKNSGPIEVGGIGYDWGKAISSTTGAFTITITCNDGVTIDECKKAFGYAEAMKRYTENHRLLTEEDNLFKPIPAYALRNSRYLVSVQYLTDLGLVRNWTTYGEGNYYFQAMAGVGNSDTARYTDVYILPKTGQGSENPVCIFGSMYIKLPTSMQTVWVKDGTTYVDISIVCGRFYNKKCADSFKEGENNNILAVHGDFGIPGYKFNDWVVKMDLGYDQVSVFGIYKDNNDTTAKYSPTYIDLASPLWWSNVVAYVDCSDTVSGEPTGETHVYALWETGNVSSVLKEGAQELIRQAFYDDFGYVPASDTMWITSSKSTPEYIASSDEAAAELLNSDASEIVFTPDNHLLLRVAILNNDPWATGKKEDREFYKGGSVYYLYNNGTSDILRSLACNFGAGTERPIYLRRNGNAFESTSATLLEHGTEWGQQTDLGGIRPAAVGIAAQLSRCLIPVGATSTMISGKISDVYTIFGSQWFGDLILDNWKGDAVIMHSGNSGVIVSLTAATFEGLAVSEAHGNRSVSWTKGDASSLTDWLEWLKQAHLRDAEDVVTICIIATLNLLPRFFMFLFILLMALSMIASVKPWQIFCDRVFDPYKFITAGRMTVHTVDLKTVVLYSMIALVLFGLFQNGLILDLIAWLTRAVTGIMNR